jgi:pimeloyl-ACP methyl ester carboxylesterase
VHRVGRGQPIVLLHGFMLSHQAFSTLIPLLSQNHDVLAIDLPGFGESDRPLPPRFSYELSAMADVVDEAMQVLKVSSAQVLGHSMGGGIGLTLAARHPERVERLVMSNPAIYPLSLPPESAPLFWPTIGKLLWKRAVPRFMLARSFRNEQVHDARSITREFLDYHWECFCRVDARESSYAMMRVLARLSNSNADPGKVRAPTLVVWGDEDRLIPISHGRRLAKTVPGARLLIVPATGHLPFLERPDEFLRQVGGFLDAARSSTLSA